MRARVASETAAKSIGADARALQFDVTNQSSIAPAAERIRKEFGRLDVLVNNAAVSHAGKPGRSLEEIAKSGRLSVVTRRRPWGIRAQGRASLIRSSRRVSRSCSKSAAE